MASSPAIDDTVHHRPWGVSFVVHLWQERDAELTLWRGYIRHIQGDEEGYFDSIEKMVSFIEKHSGLPGPPLHKPV